MKKYVGSLFLPVVILLLLSACAAHPPKNENWVQLFNGKDLDNWDIKITGFPLGMNYGNTFRVEDGLLKVRYDQYKNFDGHFGHIFYRKPYSHYRLRVEYRFVGQQCPGGASWAYKNSGIMIHGQSAESMDVNQDFPVSIEAQLLGGDEGEVRPTLNVCTPGTNIVFDGKLYTEHCHLSTAKTYTGDQWVTAELEVQGDSIIRHIIDGKVVLEYSKPQLDERDVNYQKLLPPNGDKMLRKGTISLQSESHPVDFRKVELLNLGEDCD